MNPRIIPGNVLPERGTARFSAPRPSGCDPRPTPRQDPRPWRGSRVADRRVLTDSWRKCLARIRAGAVDELPRIECTSADRDRGSPQALQAQLEGIRWRGSQRRSPSWLADGSPPTQRWTLRSGDGWLLPPLRSPGGSALGPTSRTSDSFPVPLPRRGRGHRAQGVRHLQGAAPQAAHGPQPPDGGTGRGSAPPCAGLQRLETPSRPGEPAVGLSVADGSPAGSRQVVAGRHGNEAASRSPEGNTGRDRSSGHHRSLARRIDVYQRRLTAFPRGIAGGERPASGGWHGCAHADPPRCRSGHADRVGRSLLSPRLSGTGCRASGPPVTARRPTT